MQKHSVPKIKINKPKHSTAHKIILLSDYFRVFRPPLQKNCASAIFKNKLVSANIYIFAMDF